jgi:GNAT superfamily N-acetyltransferase
MADQPERKRAKGGRDDVAAPGEGRGGERGCEGVYGLLEVGEVEVHGRKAVLLFVIPVFPFQFLSNLVSYSNPRFLCFRVARTPKLITKTVLHMLITDPAHHRRGAGALLVRWGTDQADKNNLPSFLEASEAGKALYARLGFVAEHEEVFDLAKWGGVGRDTNTLMIRPPVSK